MDINLIEIETTLKNIINKGDIGTLKFFANEEEYKNIHFIYNGFKLRFMDRKNEFKLIEFYKKSDYDDSYYCIFKSYFDKNGLDIDMHYIARFDEYINDFFSNYNKLTNLFNLSNELPINAGTVTKRVKL